MDQISQIILDFRSKAKEATNRLIHTMDGHDLANLAIQADIYLECARRLEEWKVNITKFHGMDDLWNHFSSEQLIEEFNSRYPTELDAILAHLEIAERLRDRKKWEPSPDQ